MRQNRLKRDGGRGDLQFEDHGGKRKDRLPVEWFMARVSAQTGRRRRRGARDVRNNRGSDFKGDGRAVERCAYRGRRCTHG